MLEAIKTQLLGWGRKEAAHADDILAVLAEVPEFEAAMNNRVSGAGIAPPSIGDWAPQDDEAATKGAGYGQQLVYSITTGESKGKTTVQERLDMLGLKRGAWTSFRPLAWFVANPTKFQGEAEGIAAAIKAAKGTGAFIGIGIEK